VDQGKGDDAKGYSLLELLVAISISSILISALMLSFNLIQTIAYDLHLQADRNGNLWITPLLILQWTAGAGNNRWSQGWDGVVQVDGITFFKADIDGKNGFPDQQLTSSFEDIALHHREKVLSIRSGSGFFQPVLRNMSSFEIDQVREDLLMIRWSGVTEHPLKITGEADLESAVMKLHLWNYRENLFLEEIR
jgi:prepilin-type N-terminal cleavage/methylation domain-containing protein